MHSFGADTDAQPPAETAKKEWVPAGFEALNEPQTMEVDIWYGGYFLVSSLARFTLDELQFLNPEAIVEQVPDINDVAKIQALLSQSLPTNSGRVCKSTYEIDCGTLISEDVDIIFDRANFRASLFIGPTNLSVTDSRKSRYLPDSSANLSAYSENNLYFSGDSNQSLAFNLSNDTQIAMAESRLLLRNNWTDADGFLFDTIGLQREYQGKSVSFGLIRGNAAGFDFINSEHFAGFSLESSLSTRTDLDQSYGNEIFQFFASRSLVEIYRDNRLLYSGYYDVGNHLLDTSTLPSGSYDIEIRITDIAGGTSIEQRFYSKSARLAPNDQPLYFLQLGSLVSSDRGSLLPEKVGQFVRAGYSARLSPTVGAGIGFSGTQDSSLIELSMYKMGKTFELSSGLAYETDGTLGLSADLRFNFDFLDLDFNTRQVINGKSRNERLDTAQISGNRGEYGVNLSFQAPVGRMNLFYRTNTRQVLAVAPATYLIEDAEASANEFDNSNYGVRWSFNGRKIGSGQLRTSAELSQNNNEALWVLNLTYNFSGRNSQYSLSPRYSRGVDQAGDTVGKFEGSSSADWRIGNEAQHRLSMRAYRQGKSMVEANLKTTAFNNTSDVTTRYDLGENSLSYNGSLSSALATTSNARAIGSSQNGESAFLINIDSIEGDNTEYEVLVSGSPRGKTKAGLTLLVPVAPYRTYKVEVVARGDTLVNLKENNFVKTVYPGNVIALDWSARMVKVAYGRILDEQGQPIANAVLTGTGAISITDQLGFFQLEIEQDDQSFELRKGTESCSVYFTAVDTKSMVLPLGDLKCQSMN